MKIENFIILLDSENCYSLIGKIYGEVYKDSPITLKSILDNLMNKCDTYNYKINKGELNIKGLSRFICDRRMDGKNLDIFNEYVNNLVSK